MMSPLMSSMDVASRRDCASAKFTFTPCMPLVDPPEGLFSLGRLSRQRHVQACTYKILYVSAKKEQVGQVLFFLHKLLCKCIFEYF